MKSLLLIQLLLLLVLPVYTASINIRGSKKGEEQDWSDLKWLFFGTSRTWGAKLRDRDSAYPKLISPHAINLAIPGATSEYPSRCLVSMLKPYENDGFDVIVLEFPGSPGSVPNTFVLAKRLRRRFPAAALLFLDVSSPISFDHDAMGTLNSHEGYGTIGANYLVSSSDPRNDTNHVYSPQLVDNFQKQFRGVHVVAPTSEMCGSLFIDEFGHYSEVGHAFVANLIRSKLRDMKFRTNHNPTVNRWIEMDQCENWMHDGNASSLDHNMVMNEFKSGTFALEVRQPGSYVKLINEQDDALELIVDYMQASPDCFYPSTRISTDRGDSVVVTFKRIHLPWDVHVTSQVHVATLLPGETTIHFEAMEEGTWPFRVVGILLVAET